MEESLLIGGLEANADTILFPLDPNPAVLVLRRGSLRGC